VPSIVSGLPPEEAGSTVNRKNESISQNGESGEANLRWGIPPIRWGGSVGYNLQKSSSSTGQGSTSQGIFSSLNAASYIYAPWAATVAGRIGLTHTSSGELKLPMWRTGRVVRAGIRAWLAAVR
jgi:hypothetical protein